VHVHVLYHYLYVIQQILACVLILWELREVPLYKLFLDILLLINLLELLNPTIDGCIFIRLVQFLGEDLR
jgi:hypothetical protein